jgi:hypothetical protein
VAQELGPFLIGGGAVFLTGSQGSSPGQELDQGLSDVPFIGG